MECLHVEEHLTEYVDRSLPAEELATIAEHLHECSKCASLLEDVRSVLVTCKTVPNLDLDLNLVERILLRTSGRPRTRTLREILSQHVLRPILTPRFAMGAVVGLLFLALAANLMMPKVSTLASTLSPREMLRWADRGVQHLYSGGLKLYDKKNEWQAEFTFFKNNVFNKLGFMIEQLDVPVEGKQDSGKPRQQQEKAPTDKSTVLLSPA